MRKVISASGVIGGVKGKVQVGWLVRETWERADGRLEKGKEKKMGHGVGLGRFGLESWV